MTGRVVNLRTARKQAARAEARARGTERAAQTGRSKPERALAEAREAKARTDWAAHLRDDDGE